MSQWSALNRLGPVTVAAIHLRADLKCTHCARRTLLGRRQVDHWIPRVDGGTDDLDNLVLACDDCNRRRVPGFVTPRARYAGRTRADIAAAVARQVAIPVGPGTEIYDRALAYAQRTWPDQFARRARARAGYLERKVNSFFDDMAAA